MVINFYFYIIKDKFYKILCIFIKFYNYSYSYAYSLFMNIFYVRNSWQWKDIFHSIFDRILYVIEKKVILTTTTGCVASRLNSKASTINNTFHIQCKRYVRPLQELSVEFQILKEANIIIIDEMSMMTSTLLQSIETRLRQIENDINEPYHSKLVILVGDHAQLPTICHCHLSNIENYCQNHYVYNVIDQNSTTYHILETSIRHVEDP